MAEPVWGVKVPEELKQRLSDLMEASNLSGKEFGEALANAYELSIMKDNQPLIAADIDDLQSLVNRIVEIYLNIGKRIENIITDKDHMYKASLEAKESILLTHSNKIVQLETDLKNSVEDSAKISAQLDDAKRYNTELEKMNETSRDLVNQYKEKNDTLSGIVTEYQSYKAANDQLISDINKLTTANNNLLFSIEKAGNEIRNLKTDAESKKQNYSEDLIRIENNRKEEIARLEKSHKEEIEILTKRLSVEKDNVILELKASYQEKLEKYQSENNNLHDMYNAKIRELLDSIDIQRKKASQKISDK